MSLLCKIKFPVTLGNQILATYTKGISRS